MFNFPKNQLALLDLQKIFVDRVEILDYINTRLDNNFVPLIINLYGIGGMGKTHIIRRIEEEIEKKYASKQRVGVVPIDFNYSGTSSIPNYEIIAKKLEMYGFSFPCFYSAMIIYFEEHGNYERINYFLNHMSEYPQMSDVEKNIFTTIAEKIMGSTLSSVAKILFTFDNLCKQKTPYVNNFLKNYKNIHKSEKDKFLGYALYLDIINSEHHTSENPWKIVFLLDSYEMFYEHNYPISIISDWWLFYFISNFLTPNDNQINIDSIFVISGRDRLCSQKLSGISESLIKIFPAVEELKKDDCIEYLKQSNIPESIHDNIYKQCNGYPFPLQMFSFHYFQLQERGEVLLDNIELSADDHSDLYQKIIEYLPSNVKILLESLAFCYWFDRRIMSEIAKEIHRLSWSEQSFSNISGYSFCIRIDGEKYYLQKSFKKILINNYIGNLEPDAIERKHRAIYNIFKEYYEKENGQIDNLTKILIIREMVCHGILIAEHKEKTLQNLKLLINDYQDVSFVSNFILNSLMNDTSLIKMYSDVISTHVQQFPLNTFHKLIRFLSYEKKIYRNGLEDLIQNYFTDNYFLKRSLKSGSLNSLKRKLKISKQYVDLNNFLINNISNEDYSSILLKSSLSQVRTYLIGLKIMLNRGNDNITNEEQRFIDIFIEKDIHLYVYNFCEEEIDKQIQITNAIIRINSHFMTLNRELSNKFNEKLSKELSDCEKTLLIFNGYPDTLN